MNLSEVLLRYLYERLINIQHGEMIPLSHGKLPVLPRLTTHRNTLYWDKYIKMVPKAERTTANPDVQLLSSDCVAP